MVRTGTPPARSQRKRTSTLVIQARAGVSRGRLLHHFPSREELLVAAVQHLASHRLKQTEDRVATLLAGEPEGPQRADRCVELLWATFQEPHFWAAMELWTAARTSPALAAALRPEERRLREAIRGVADGGPRCARIRATTNCARCCSPACGGGVAVRVRGSSGRHRSARGALAGDRPAAAVRGASTRGTLTVALCAAWLPEAAARSCGPPRRGDGAATVNHDSFASRLDHDD